MHCASCSRATEKALSGVAGVSRASVSLSLQQAEIEYDPEVTTQVGVALLPCLPNSSNAGLAVVHVHSFFQVLCQ